MIIKKLLYLHSQKNKKMFLRKNQKKWLRGRAVRQRSAKPCTAVRIRSQPPQKKLIHLFEWAFFL